MSLGCTRDRKKRGVVGMLESKKVVGRQVGGGQIIPHDRDLFKMGQ